MAGRSALTSMSAASGWRWLISTLGSNGDKTEGTISRAVSPRSYQASPYGWRRHSRGDPYPGSASGSSLLRAIATGMVATTKRMSGGSLTTFQWTQIFQERERIGGCHADDAAAGGAPATA